MDIEEKSKDEKSSDVDKVHDIESIEKASDSKRPMSFYIRRIFGFIICALLYALVFFQRTCPSIVSDKMAADYGVAVKDIGVFSSIFFYPYGIVQPFAGLLSDVVEPAFVIGISQFIAGIGSIVCGLSENMAVGCIGRFLVGLGCGPTYVPIVRIVANWFPLRFYSHMCGALLAIGGVGGIVAQGPLTSLSKLIGWRWCFYGIGGIGIILSVLEMIFVRGDPQTLGYKPINKNIESKAENESSIKDKFVQLFANFKQVVTYPWFWLIVVYCIFCSGPYFDISGLWGGPFLQDVFKFESTKTGNTLIALSVGLIAGSIFVPPLSSLFRTRKWVLFTTCLIAFISLLIFTILGSKLPFAVVIILFLFIGMFTNSMTSVCYPLVREYFHPALAGSAVGCVNIFTFLSTAIFQNVSSEVIASVGHIEGSSAYTERGYQIGLWTICTASMGVATIAIGFAKDSVPEVRHKKDQPSISDDEHDQVGSDLGEL